MFYTSILSNPKEPKGIYQALRSKESNQWREFTQNKFQNFINFNLWKVASQEEAKWNGKTVIGSKWVFKKKSKQDSSTRFKSRIVSKGYMQIPGFNYMKKFAPIANNTTTRLIIALYLYFIAKGWECKSVDIKAAFFKGYNKGLQYMEWPLG